MDLKVVTPQKCVCGHLLDGEAMKSNADLVRCVSLWFMDAGISAIKKVVGEGHVVNVKVHDVEFITDLREDDFLFFESMAVHTGNATVTTYICCNSSEPDKKRVAQGFVSFVLKDGRGCILHNRCAIEPQTPEEWRLFDRVCAFSFRKHLMKSNLRYVKCDFPRK